MRKFGQISSLLWRSKKFKALNSDLARLAYVYLHTCQHGNSIGCYYLPPAWGAEDLGVSVEEYAEAIGQCEGQGMILVDAEECMIRIRGFFDVQPVTNPKHATGAMRFALDLPDSPAKLEVITDILEQKFVTEHSELQNLLWVAQVELKELYPFDSPIEALRDTDTDTDTDTILDTETKTDTVTLAQQDGASSNHLNTSWIKRTGG